MPDKKLIDKLENTIKKYKTIGSFFMQHIKWESNQLILLDQRKLPYEEEYYYCNNHYETAEAISKMIIRGAPAIGATAAFGYVLGLKHVYENEKLAQEEKNRLEKTLNEVEKILKDSRPTAVNLHWAVDRIKNKLLQQQCENISKMIQVAEKEAIKIAEEDKEINKTIGEQGKTLIANNSTILTHCNAGALATVDYGTALGVIRRAHKEKHNISVIIGETRPYLQGARLTTWELLKEKIPVTLITDNMVGYCMKNNLIDIAIVGADRIAKNGDTANKIGTYSLALLATYHQIPFYIAAPSSTFDLSIKNGDEIPIEFRSKEEVIKLNNHKIAPEEVEVLNPSFDITPHELIQGIITEKGIIESPNLETVTNFFIEGD